MEDLLSSYLVEMMDINKCRSCGQECKNKLCRDCENKKHNTSAIISQNCLKLKKLLNEAWFNFDGFDRFKLYVGNITKNMVILLRFKDLEK